MQSRRHSLLLLRTLLDRLSTAVHVPQRSCSSSHRSLLHVSFPAARQTPRRFLAWPAASLPWLAGVVSQVSLSHSKSKQCSSVSSRIGNFQEIAAWLVFVLGLLNIALGLIFRASLRDTRALVADPNSPVGTASRVIKSFRSNNEAPSAAYQNMEQTPQPARTKDSVFGRDRKIINISAPFTSFANESTSSPPTYIDDHSTMSSRNVRFM